MLFLSNCNGYKHAVDGAKKEMTFSRSPFALADG